MTTLTNYTTGESELDYCHQKLNKQAASSVAKSLQTQNLRKYGNISKMSKFCGGIFLHNLVPHLSSRNKICCQHLKKKSTIANFQIEDMQISGFVRRKLQYINPFFFVSLKSSETTSTLFVMLLQESKHTCFACIDAKTD